MDTQNNLSGTVNQYCQITTEGGIWVLYNNNKPTYFVVFHVHVHPFRALRVEVIGKHNRATFRRRNSKGTNSGENVCDKGRGRSIWADGLDGIEPRGSFSARVNE